MYYIKRVKGWNKADWEKYFKQYPQIKTDEDKKKVKMILTSSKGKIEKNEWVLTYYGIINGIGPGYFSAFFRFIITILFSNVKYFWHDIEYGIFGTEEDKVRADNGLLKYSIEGIYSNFLKISDLSINIIFKIIFSGLYAIVSVVQFIIAVFCWAMVRLFGKTAFSYETPRIY